MKRCHVIEAAEELAVQIEASEIPPGFVPDGDSEDEILKTVRQTYTNGSHLMWKLPSCGECEHNTAEVCPQRHAANATVREAADEEARDIYSRWLEKHGPPEKKELPQVMDTELLSITYPTSGMAGPLSSDADVAIDRDDIDFETMNSTVHDVLRNRVFLSLSRFPDAIMSMELDDRPGITTYQVRHATLDDEERITIEISRQPCGSRLTIYGLKYDDYERFLHPEKIRAWRDFVRSLLLYLTKHDGRWQLSKETKGTVQSTKDGASDIVPADLKLGGGKYGTCRDISFDDTKAIVKRCREFQATGGTVPHFHEQLGIDPGKPRSFELDTLRSWLKNPKFAPEDT